MKKKLMALGLVGVVALASSKAFADSNTTSSEEPVVIECFGDDTQNSDNVQNSSDEPIISECR